MTKIISVRFKPGGKQYYFAPQGLKIKAGDGVVLDTAQGLSYGECVRGNHLVTDDMVLQPLRTVVRVATQRDKFTAEKNRQREKDAMRICRKKIARHGLDMKLVDAECSFEGNKILFFFTSDGRVDFRALVKDLATSLHARIELRQIGVRDAARMLGGLGICGKPFCCGQFLKQFQPVSIKMAKTQDLSLNPAKISGTCGRLMCCLKYEQNAYEDAVKRCPRQESFVETPDGVGTVTAVNLLRERVRVSLEDSEDSPQTYSVKEINVVRSGKGKRPEGYVPPPPEELARLRLVPEEPEDKAAAPSLSEAVEQAISDHQSAAPAPKQKKKPKKYQQKQAKPRPEKTASTTQEEQWEDMAQALPSVKKINNASRRSGRKSKRPSGGKN
ncbi:MAG: stage 0 sporulation family protein [Oscillospiraceae bacterium]|nr:stage 0 sporulation family protein [Oscillospiraceae bacterium]